MVSQEILTYFYKIFFFPKESIFGSHLNSLFIEHFTGPFEMNGPQTENRLSPCALD